MRFKSFISLVKTSVIVCALAGWALSTTSCKQQSVNPNLYFDIDTLMPNVYITNTDSSQLSLLVKFLYGTDEPLTLTISGLPPKTTLTQDSITGSGNFYANFEFHCDSTPLGIYPAQLITYSSTTHMQTKNFNIVVTYANCAAALAGKYSPNYSCSAASYTDSVAITATGTNTLNFNNIGGYGSIVNAAVTMSCNTDSFYIARQNVGNGITMYGIGYLNNLGQIVINYTAVNPPTALGDSVTCTMTLVK
jgi:hypothetical protein